MAMENGKTTMQKEQRPFEERYAEFKENVSKRFEEAHKKQEAFYHLKPDFIKMPVAGLPGKDGKRHPFQKENAAILMQSALDKGIEDSRWISQNQIKAQGLFIKKGEKATLLSANDPKTKEPNRLVAYFNVNQLAESSQRKVEAAGESRYRDTVAQKMAEYLKENISFKKGANLSEQFEKAFEFGREQTQALDRSWGEKRMAAIMAVDLRAPAENCDMKLRQEAKRILSNNPDEKRYMVLAVAEVLKDGKFDQEAVAKSVSKVAPKATGLNYQSDYIQNYGKNVVEAAVRNDAQLNHDRMVAASR